MWYLLLFFFVATGAKLILALLTVYLVLPGPGSCDVCDGDTVSLRMGPFGRCCAWLCFGRLQRRWCPRCGWTGLARGPRPNRLYLGPSAAAPIRRTSGMSR